MIIQTMKNPAIVQASFVATSIGHHQGSSQTPILSSTKPKVKGLKKMSPEISPLSAEIQNLWDVNNALSKRQKARQAL